MKIKKSYIVNDPNQPGAMQLADSLIISIGEARKMLGAEAKELSDDELVTQIYQLSELAQAVLKCPFIT